MAKGFEDRNSARPEEGTGCPLRDGKSLGSVVCLNIRTGTVQVEASGQQSGREVTAELGDSEQFTSLPACDRWCGT